MTVLHQSREGERGHTHVGMGSATADHSSQDCRQYMDTQVL